MNLGWRWMKSRGKKEGKEKEIDSMSQPGNPATCKLRNCREPYSARQENRGSDGARTEECRGDSEKHRDTKEIQMWLLLRLSIS